MQQLANRIRRGGRSSSTADHEDALALLVEQLAQAITSPRSRCFDDGRLLSTAGLARCHRAAFHD